MQTSSSLLSKLSERKFPSFSLERLLKTVFDPQPNEKLCILIDLEHPADIHNFAFLKKNAPVQKKAYEVFYQALRNDLMQKLKLKACDIFAYKTTGGSNLELPLTAIAPNGSTVQLERDIYSVYDIILCFTNYSATAPLTASSKKHGFRGGTLHGLNDTILASGLAVDYNEVSRQTEQLRMGMTQADSVDIDFEVEGKPYHLHIDLEKQEAQKSHGICRSCADVVNLPAGEVYFVPKNAKGSFPIKFEKDGTLALMHVDHCRVNKVTLIKGNQKRVEALQQKFDSDPAAGILGELGFGTQVLPFSGRDIQDEKIFGTFHLATGRNDHLKGDVNLGKFKNWLNATHDDILFSANKTPEIYVKSVRMKRKGKTEALIENYEPSAYLWGLLS